MSKSTKILLVEDDANDVELTLMALAENHFDQRARGARPLEQ
jgi:hypothetical protein